MGSPVARAELTRTGQKDKQVIEPKVKEVAGEGKL
jgi:hypothetical protein